VLKILLGITLCLTVSVGAQNYRGSLRGRLVDPSSRPISGAELKAVKSDTNETRTVRTLSNGEFAISLLPPGNYRLEIELNGYKKFVQEVTVEVNQQLWMDLKLEVGTLNDTMTVPSPKANLDKDSVASGAVIAGAQVSGLPLDGRNFLELSLLVTGAVPAAPGSAGSVRGDFAFNINGTREDANNFLLDGVYNFDPKLNTFGVKPSVDAVREFEVLSGTYDASFGRSAGAQVNIVLKSGTNRFHGTAYEFFRNQVLDARNFFAPPTEDAPQYQRNQFGFSLGGPVRTDRTFFFVDYDGTRVREGITRVTNVPTLAERSGDFSKSFFPKPVDPSTGQRFPGDVIPSFYLNPVGVKLAALYPLPNRSTPFQNFVSSPAQRDRLDQFDARVDHTLGGHDNLAVRYSFSDRDLFEPFTGPAFAAIPGYGDSVPRRAQNAMVGETHLFSPRLINDIRFAYSRVASGVFQQNMDNNLNQAVGLPTTSKDPRDTGLSLVSLTGFSPIGDEYNNPQHSTTNTYQLLDTATYVMGRHLAKFGADFRWVQQNGFRDIQARGFVTFSPQAYTLNALADMLLGLPVVTGVAHIDNAQHLRSTSYNFFGNDAFRVRPWITLTAGLRYEYNSPPVDTRNRATLYDPATGTTVQVGTNGIPRGGYDSDRNNFAPRVGLAWTVGKSGTTVLRAGYGIYYDQSPLAPGEGLYFNAPFYNLGLFVPLPGLPISLSDPFPASYPFPLPVSAFTFQRDLRTAYVQQWNLNVQQQLGRSRVFELAYAGSKGTKLLTARDINQPQPSTRVPNLRPNPFFDDITEEGSFANSSYHSLQARMEQRLDFDLSFFASYTYSKSIDNASGFFSSAGDPNFPQNSYDLSAERGRSNFDLRHRFSLSYSYDLPFGRGRAFLSDRGWISSVLSGWQSYGVISLQTGFPFTVALLSEIDRSNTGRSSLGFGANDRPNLVGNPRLSNGTPEGWFNTQAFAFPPFGSFGNSGRNILDGPSYHNVNFSLVKDTALREGVRLQLRAEFFNLFNHPNFDLPNNFLGSPTFGAISSAQNPRHIQFGAKLLF
jgi:hypothetical protein